MIPPHLVGTFRSLPDDLIGLCRPHTWEQLTILPAAGMRPIRDILVHMIGAESFWIRHVVLGQPRRKFSPEAFTDLDAILSEWKPQREATIAFASGLSAEQRASRRPFPWDASQSASLEEIVWHVVTHEQYHRGQVFARLALLGRRDLPDYDMLR